MAELIALYLAGLSFFFTGVSGVSDNLQQLSGQKFRQILSRATTHPFHAALIGAALGAITQSTSVVAVILAGMTASGLLSMRRSLIVLAYSNIGTALLVFITVLDLHLPTLYVVGISGLILAFNLFRKWKPIFGATLALGLVFFGLDVMKNAFKPLSGMQGFSHVGAFFDYWPDAAFFVGILMRTVIHSSSAAAAVTITLNHGMLEEFSSMMSLAGLGIGTAVATYLLASNLRGVPRQIALYQAVGNIAAGLLLAGALILERNTGMPLLMAGVNHLSGSVSGRMAIMYFLFNIGILLVSLAILPWAPAWLEKMCPPTLEQDLSRPMYIQTEALNSPETALDLVAMEQLRMLRALRHYLDAVRGDRKLELKTMHESVGVLGGEITLFMEALVSMPISPGLAARVISFQRKQETLRALEDNVFLLAQTLHDLNPLPDLADRIVEALDTITLTALDALQSKDALDLNLLTNMTDDRGSMMERLRSRVAVEETGNVGNVAALHYATTLFERNVWLLRQLALWLREELAVAV